GTACSPEQEYFALEHRTESLKHLRDAAGWVFQHSWRYAERGLVGRQCGELSLEIAPGIERYRDHFRSHAEYIGVEAIDDAAAATCVREHPKHVSGHRPIE